MQQRKYVTLDEGHKDAQVVMVEAGGCNYSWCSGKTSGEKMGLGDDRKDVKDSVMQIP